MPKVEARDHSESISRACCHIRLAVKVRNIALEFAASKAFKDRPGHGGNLLAIETVRVNKDVRRNFNTGKQVFQRLVLLFIFHFEALETAEIENTKHQLTNEKGEVMIGL